MSKKGRPAGPKKTLFRKRLTAAELQAVQAVLADSPQPAGARKMALQWGNDPKCTHTLGTFQPAWEAYGKLGSLRCSLCGAILIPEDPSPGPLPLPPSVSAGLGSLTQPAPILTPAEMAEHARAAQDAFDDELAARTQEERAKQLGCTHEWEAFGTAGGKRCVKCMTVWLPPAEWMPAGGAEKNSTATPSGSSQGGPGAADLSAALARSNEQLRLQTQRADDLQAQVDELNEACERHLLRIEELMQTGGTERQSAYIAQLLAKIEQLGGKKGEFDQT